MSKDIIKQHHSVQNVFFSTFALKWGIRALKMSVSKNFLSPAPTPAFVTLISTLPQAHPHRHTHTN